MDCPDYLSNQPSLSTLEKEVINQIKGHEQKNMMVYQERVIYAMCYFKDFLFLKG